MALFNRHKHANVTVIECPAVLDASAGEELLKGAHDWTQELDPLYVFDFSHSKSVSPDFFRPILVFHQAVKLRGSFISSIHINDEILKSFRDFGLEVIVCPRPNLEIALRSVGIRSTKYAIDSNFFGPFVKATKMTIETQANTKVVIGKPFLKGESFAPATDIAGVISVSSNVFQGAIALCFHAKTFLHVYSNMVMEPHDTITKEIEDAAAELLNIIFGVAKAELNTKENYAIQKAIPTIVRGNGLKVHHLMPSVAVVLPFETAEGTFYLEICTDDIGS
jgi:CheY-specific phosphatase CheX